MIAMKFGHSLLFAILCTGPAMAQEPAATPHAHGHDHRPNEIGVANSGVLFIGENAYSYGLHLHYIRTVRKSAFGVGLGFERIFDVHKHNTIGVVASYRVWNGLSLLLSPGITFEDEDVNAILPALHVEVAYELELAQLHIGPCGGVGL